MLVKKRFVARIVPRFSKAEPAVHDRPAGERAGRGLHIGLAVVSDAKREQFQQLAGQVLVGVPLAVGIRIEPHEHRRVLYYRT